MRLSAVVLVAPLVTACVLARDGTLASKTSPILQSCDAAGGGVGAGLYPSLHRSSPIAVHLLRTEHTRYRPLDEISFQLKITNVSDAEVVVPLSPPAPKVCRQPDLIRAEVELITTPGAGSKGYVGASTLWGSPGVPGTTRRLAAGDDVIVTVSTRLSNDSRLLQPAPFHTVQWQLRVELYLDTDRDVQVGPIDPATSDNTISIDVVAPVPAVLPRSSPTERTERPRIVDVSPAAAPVGTVVRVDGHQFGGLHDHPAASLSNGALTVAIQGFNYRLVSNDTNRYPEQAILWLPADLSPGEWLLTLTVRGQTSEPFPIAILEGTAPRLDHLDRERANPGGTLNIWGAFFGYRDDSIEFTDASGRMSTSSSSTDVQGIALGVPVDASEGEATIRVRRGALVSNALSVVVSRRPLRPEISPDALRSVARLQWFDLWLWPENIFVPPDRVVVEFEQDGQRFPVIAVLTERAARVPIPRGLHAGSAVLRACVWRFGEASEWSQAIPYEVASRPVPAVVDFVQVGAAAQDVYLLRSPSFRASPGDELLLSGNFPVPDLKDLRITAEGPHGRRRVKSEKEGDNTIRAHLPRELVAGAWELVLEGPRMATTRVPLKIVPW